MEEQQILYIQIQIFFKGLSDSTNHKHKTKRFKCDSCDTHKSSIQNQKI